MTILEHVGSVYVKDDNETHFDSFCFEHVPKEIKKFISNKILQKYIYTIQAYDSIMSRCFCTEFICYMFNNKSVTDFTNLS